MSFRFSRTRNRRGLSRPEVLLLLGVTIVLAVVAVGPMRVELRTQRMARGVESARTLDTLLAQYATDNGGVYPVGEGTPAEGKSEGIALDLLQNNYTPNADVFAVGSTPKYRGAAKDFADLAPENVSWDFTAGATATTGITTAAPDVLPVLYTTGETVDYASAPGRGLVLSPSGKGPFGEEGVVVAYKGGDALFISAPGDPGAVPPAFISKSFTDTGTYTQIKP